MVETAEELKQEKWGNTAKETIKGQNSREEENEKCSIIKFHFCSNEPLLKCLFLRYYVFYLIFL